MKSVIEGTFESYTFPLNIFNGMSNKAQTGSIYTHSVLILHTDILLNDGQLDCPKAAFCLLEKSNNDGSCVI